MREIKFRVWDGKKMHYPGEPLDNAFCLTMGGTLHSYHMTNRSDWVKHCIPLQFTGLHDADGKEIYEGDVVVDLKGRDPERPLIVSFNRENLGGVLGWNLLTPDGSAYQFYYGESPDEGHRIIGNIYENPELL